MKIFKDTLEGFLMGILFSVAYVAAFFIIIIAATSYLLVSFLTMFSTSDKNN